MKISTLVGDMSFTCIGLALILMGIGHAMYIRMFWGKGIAQAMKQDRLPLASRLIYSGAGSAVIGIVLFLYSMLLFFQKSTKSVPTAYLFLFGTIATLISIQLFRGVWKQWAKPIRILTVVLVYVFECAMMYGFIKSVTPPAPTENSTGMYR